MDAKGNGSNGSAPDRKVSAGVADRLRHLTQQIPPDEICDLWIFPPLTDLEGSSEFFLLARRNGGKTLRVYSARLPMGAREGSRPATEPAQGPRPDQEVVEHGSVPLDRLGRVVEGFRRRLGDDREPLHLELDGRGESWADLLEPIAEATAAGD